MSHHVSAQRPVAARQIRALGVACVVIIIGLAAFGRLPPLVFIVFAVVGLLCVSSAKELRGESDDGEAVRSARFIRGLALIGVIVMSAPIVLKGSAAVLGLLILMLMHHWLTSRRAVRASVILSALRMTTHR